jgi:CBS domain-containing protein
MTVARILSSKGYATVSTQPHRTLAETASLLSEKGIGAVIVCGADGQILGILSERDIIKAVASRGAEALNDAVSRHMTSKVVTCTPNSRIHDIMERMTAGKFRHMPVAEGGRLTGIISIGDVVKHRLAEMEQERQALESYITS